MAKEDHDKIVLEALLLMFNATIAGKRVISQENVLMETTEEEVIEVASEVDGSVAADHHPTEEVAETEVTVVMTVEPRSSVKVFALPASRRVT